MKYKLFLLVFFGFFFVSFVSADSQTFQVRYIVPASDTTPPAWTNLRNLTGYNNTAFSQSITATDPSGISCYYLNDTSTFDVDCSGTITNSTIINTVAIYYLNISVNDTLGNVNWGEFYINITEFPASQCDSVFNYTKMATWNTRPYIQLCQWRDFR